MEKLTVEIPPESLCIREARCANGHSLMDTALLMGGSPSIKVHVRGTGYSGDLNLHPCYGNYELRSRQELLDGEVYELLCPHCSISLACEDELCMFCGAPMFSLHLPKGGRIYGCLRRGCRNHRLKVVDLNAQLAELFELDRRPRY